MQLLNIAQVFRAAGGSLHLYQMLDTGDSTVGPAQRDCGRRGIQLGELNRILDEEINVRACAGGIVEAHDPHALVIDPRLANGRVCESAWIRRDLRVKSRPQQRIDGRECVGSLQVENQIKICRDPIHTSKHYRDTADADIANAGVVQCLKDAFDVHG